MPIPITILQSIWLSSLLMQAYFNGINGVLLPSILWMKLKPVWVIPKHMYTFQQRQQNIMYWCVSQFMRSLNFPLCHLFSTIFTFFILICNAPFIKTIISNAFIHMWHIENCPHARTQFGFFFPSFSSFSTFYSFTFFGNCIWLLEIYFHLLSIATAPLTDNHNIKIHAI